MGIQLLIEFVIMLLVLGVLYWITTLLVSQFGLPGIIVQIVGVLIVIVIVIWLLQVLAGYAGSGPIFLWRSK